MKPPCNHIRRLLSIFVFFAGCSLCHSQWIAMTSEADSLIKVGSEHIYNLQFDKAHSCFSVVIQKYPEHPAGYFLDAMIEWWRINTNRRSTKFDEQFLQKIEKTLNVCDKLLELDQYNITALFFKGGALGYRGRFYSVHESWLEAAADGKTAFDVLVSCQKLAPGNHDIMLGTGVYNYFAATLPEQYPILQSLMIFLPRGDKRLGVLQLQAASKQARYAATEAKVVLLQIYYQFEKNPTNAIVYAKELVGKYPNNPYFQKYYGRCMVQLGMNVEFEELWRNVVLKYMDKTPGYDQEIVREALYYVGLAVLQKGDYETALKYFYKCDEAGRYLDQDVSGFTIKVNLHIGKIYDLQGKRELALKQYNKVLSWEERQGSHQEANALIKTPHKR